MKAAVIILAHNKPLQLNRLISRLQNKDLDIYIHIDKKNEHMRSEVNIDYPGVNLVKENVEVYWGTFSQVQATLNSLKEACLHGNYEYFILLSGQDYPIKSIDCIKEFLEKNKDKCFMEYRKVEKNGWGAERLNKYYLIKIREMNDRYLYAVSWFGIRILYKITQACISLFENIITLTAKTFWKNPSDFLNMQLYGGSQWWILSKKAVEYIFDFMNKEENFIKGMKRCRIPDELFFQTVLLNSNLNLNIINNNYRYLDMKDEEFHPRVLKISDYQKLIKSEGLFARKFNCDEDEEIFNLLDNYTN